MSGWRDKVCGEQGRGMGLPATQEKRFVSYQMRYFTQSCGFSTTIAMCATAHRGSGVLLQ